MEDHNLSQGAALLPANELLYQAPGMGLGENQRAEMTLSCRDTDYLPRVKNAGKTEKVKGVTVQVMHNGLVVQKGAYQGEWQAKVIEGLKGNHEPQEEKVYYEVLKRIEPGGLIMELGSWWSYYSMWFLKEVKDSKAICCEPDPDNLKVGKQNLELNEIDPDRVSVYEAASGDQDGKQISFVTENKRTVKVPVRTVDSIMSEKKLDKLDILHMDIQGAELAALKGAKKSIQARKIRFVFVSTHHYLISGDPLMHQKCRDFITDNGGHIVAEHTVAESCSGDGLIVASFSDKDKDFRVTTSLQPTDKSLFRSPDRDVAILWEAHSKLTQSIADLQQKIVKADDEAETLNQKLRWINRHPVRFALGNLYHYYIKRDRRG